MDLMVRSEKKCCAEPSVFDVCFGSLIEREILLSMKNVYTTLKM